jgi:tetratricopeptide (TPR) repeat protein
MRNSLAFVFAGLVACGGSTKGPEGPGSGGGAGGGGKPQGPGDVSFDIQPQQIEGMLFEPEALISPGMPLVQAKRAMTLEKQRQTFEKTKDPVLKEAQAAILATMLYQKSKTAKPEEQIKLYEEARQVLRDAAAVSGDKADEITVRLLGSYELLLEDYAAAEKAWAAFVAKAPKDKDIQTNKAWLAYTLLKQGKNGDALAAIQGETLTEKVPELAYVAAWAKFRTGDRKEAFDALLVAAKGWGTMPAKEALDRDVFLFAGRTEKLSLADAVSALSPRYAKNNDQHYNLYVKLGLESYAYAGRWADGVAALEKAIETAADKVPVNDRHVIRFTQADYTVRLDNPETAAKYAIQAINALPGCGTKCSDTEKSNLVVNAYMMGRLFHVVYATAHDDRYYQPAHDLYMAAVPKIVSDAKMLEQAQKDADTLEKTFKTMKAGVGTHDKGALGVLLSRHNQEVQACYEVALASNAKLAGNLTLTLESDQTGVIKGASTEPAGGAQDMALVASCVTERAKSWKLPQRAQAGTTRIKIAYSMKAREGGNKKSSRQTQPTDAVQGADKSAKCCKVCKEGKACGGSCIPKGQKCNEGAGCACDG